MIVKFNAYNFIAVVTVALILYTNYDCDREDDEDDDAYDISNYYPYQNDPSTTNIINVYQLEL